METLGIIAIKTVLGTALVVGVGYWLQKRRKPVRDMTPDELEQYQG
jgi:hypothetical protein